MRLCGSRQDFWHGLDAAGYVLQVGNAFVKTRIVIRIAGRKDNLNVLPVERTFISNRRDVSSGCAVLQERRVGLRVCDSDEGRVTASLNDCRGVASSDREVRDETGKDDFDNCHDLLLSSSATEYLEGAPCPRLTKRGIR